VSQDLDPQLPNPAYEYMSEESILAMNGGAEMDGYERLFIFVVFTQLMQSLMSYDGGATQMSTELLLSNGWSSSELGLLGAMDKFGSCHSFHMELCAHASQC